MDDCLVENINSLLQTDFPPGFSDDEILHRLHDLVDYLVRNDFQKLVLILYKVDVSEMKLKTLLQVQSEEDAALIIAKLIVEREKQKIVSRNLYPKKNDIPDEESW